MSDLVLHELTGSPNNVKVRVALGYKGLEYERRPVDVPQFPGDRTSVFSISRQPRLPVLQHGKTVIFDSAAIIRYLEANFRDSPPLFVDDYITHGEIEQWELFAKTQISEPIGMLFQQAFAPEPDTNVIAAANRMMNERTGAIEDKLSTNEFLVGEQMTAADVVCGSSLYLTDISEKAVTIHPIAGFFRQHMSLGEGREKTRAWVRRVTSYDPVVGRR